MFLGIKTGKWSMHYAMPFQKPLYWIQFSHTNWVLATWWVLMIHEMNGDTQTFSSILCFSGSIQGLIPATSWRDTRMAINSRLGFFGGLWKLLGKFCIKNAESVHQTWWFFWWTSLGWVCLLPHLWHCTVMKGDVRL